VSRIRTAVGPAAPRSRRVELALVVLHCVAMSSLWLDLRYAVRMMVKRPSLTAILVVTLALGIGASTTIFSVVNSVVLRSLPYDQPDQLVRVYTEFRSTGSFRTWIRSARSSRWSAAATRIRCRPSSA
jgi:hypothetical protein